MTPATREQLDIFISNLVQAAKATLLYSPDHRITAEHAAKALEHLTRVLATENSLEIIRLGGDLFVSGRPLEKTAHVDRINRQMSAYGIGHITIQTGAGRNEIQKLIQIIAKKEDTLPQATPHLMFGTVAIGDPRNTPGKEYRAIPAYNAIPDKLMTEIAEDFASCPSKDHFDLNGVMSLVAGFVTAFRGEANPLMALVPLREMDEYTFTHSLDVCILNLAQGMALGFEGQVLHDIGVAAMLHDVGKQFVSKDVLNKPGKLDDAEWEEMRRHTVYGANYLLNTPGMPRIAVMSAFEHHMKFNMSGYPKVAPGWETNLCSQITMVSDFFDALRTKRVYKDSMDFEKVAGIMLEIAGTELNPALVLNFIKTLRKMGEH